MIDLLYRIKNSQPTIVGEEAARFLAAIIQNPDWVVASTAVLGLEETIEKANYYLSFQARIELHGEMLYSLQPIHICYLDETQLRDGWVHTWILLYSNGAVVYSEKEGGTEPFLILFMDESLVDPEFVVEIPIEQGEP